jgi:murein DD-endopeptidase MepM/ murein hydrolase activator NlpD
VHQNKAAQQPTFGKLGTRSDSHTLILARGDHVRSFAIRPWMVMICSALLLTIGASFLTATAYLVFRDDILTAAIARQHYLREHYENRIALLRQDIDRITSKQLLNQEEFEARLAHVLDRQDAIAQRDRQMADLLEYARRKGWALEQMGRGNTTARTPPEPVSREDASLSWEFDTMRDMAGHNPKIAIETVQSALASSQDRQVVLLDHLTHVVKSQKSRIQTTMAEAGVSPEKLMRLASLQSAGAEGEAGQGGPLLPPEKQELLSGSRFDRQAQYFVSVLDEMALLREGLHYLPVRLPARHVRRSSNFGNRKDPFTGRQAFHSGVDFAAPSGHPVRATGAGEVVFAGRKGGYGLMVEIEHGLGWTTRYAHLSSLNVEEGEKVESGTLIGQVGSTGRSTGPHLHYETRLNDRPVNPERFLRAGEDLAGLL